MGLVFVTSNRNKLSEVRALLGARIKSAEVPLDEVQSISVEAVARHKAVQAYGKLHAPVLVEDTGLYIEGLKGFPGPMVKWAERGLGYEGMCRLVDMCKDRRVYAETCIAFCDGRTVRLFTGRMNGTVAMRPKGITNFGWDCIFIPEGHGRTFAQISMKEKNRISARGKAVLKLRRFLKGKNLV